MRGQCPEGGRGQDDRIPVMQAEKPLRFAEIAAKRASGASGMGESQFPRLLRCSPHPLHGGTLEAGRRLPRRDEGLDL